MPTNFPPAAAIFCSRAIPGWARPSSPPASHASSAKRVTPVVYDTAAHIFERFEAQKFSRDETGGADEDVSRLLRCDLLIIDDLGTELTTEFVRSAFYQIVNTRLMTNKKTIISTNLSPAELSRRYGANILSRIEGAYRILPFFGDDIRKQKK